MEKEKIISIIIPYYKTLELTKKLFEVLTPQLDDDIEVLLIDDGCNEKELDNLKATVIHLPENSGNASKPRNVGLDNAKGKYILFIDSDDMVSKDYIKSIRDATKYEWDYCYFSWKTDRTRTFIYDEPPKWNCSIWNCCYKRELIGNTRFREDLNIAEDYVFNQEVRKGKRYVIPKVLYHYNNGRPGSLMNRR